jgi:hypothetical protein
MGDGGVGVQDLLDEQVEGGDGVELALPPAMAHLTAGLPDHRLGKEGFQVLLDSPQRT